MIASGVPTTRLTTIHRQSENSLIAVNCAKVRQGEMISSCTGSGGDFYIIRQGTDQGIADKVRKVVKLCLDNGIEANQIQVLTPQHKGECGDHALNAMLKDMLNPSERGVQTGKVMISVGDRVMNNKNNYQLGISNGETGEVVGAGVVLDEQGRPSEQVQVLWDGGDKVSALKRDEFEEVTQAYTITVHKSQGSEYRVVIVVMSREHRFSHCRNNFYTAISRGKQKVYVIGDPAMIELAINNNRPTQRFTLLREFLMEDTQ